MVWPGADLLVCQAYRVALPPQPEDKQAREQQEQAGAQADDERAPPLQALRRRRASAGRICARQQRPSKTIAQTL